MKKWIVLLLVILFSSISHALTLEDLQQRFSQHKVIRAKFKQLRHLTDIPIPLKSSGELLLSQEYGLWWHQLSPYSVTVILDQKKMVQKIDDQLVQLITAESNPQLFQFNHLLQAVFYADIASLQEKFKIEFTLLADNKWQLQLIPYVSPLDKLFKQINLQGDNYLDQIELIDQMDDKTIITFSEQNSQPGMILDEERQRFKSE